MGLLMNSQLIYRATMENEMKKTILAMMAAVLTLFFTASAMSEVMSLRGNSDLNAMAEKPAKKTVQSIKGGIARSYKQQPPMVPHTTDKYKINLKNNGCMKCHSEKTYKKEKSPKVGDSHYVTRDGKTQSAISSRRYFCNQCHATQMGAEPLVKNMFEGVK
ncbi:MAG: nitrate reductase [endosymbiont of Seepiophila jonesi]|uniref:Periplasmic nitrate reductase, electron transfer subunit n=1 Tax=endosymbiont of Lamellibrachia luymesi TaxID=2200907 RepID=A0A370DWJ9_9GAMM|nr:MAG: nitrate reductase [endosymbiont of Lamellibrachia luymesi]RDH92968.1 MAG: nitrate reductase [endosymbiont of Seepiophila jonesi]